jgi:peptidoglycan hydrolase-like protein with peptidoglycan-binding domain
MKNKYSKTAITAMETSVPGKVLGAAAFGIMAIALAFAFVPIAQADVTTTVTTQGTTQGFVPTLVSANASSALASNNCVDITSNLYLGASDYFFSGSNVAKLQNFLISRGYLHVNATGFYGVLTFGAVRDFQRDNGIWAIGGAGPLTRAHILAMTCGTAVPPVSAAPAITSLAPASGATGTTVTVYGSGFDSNTTVSFGGGIAVGPYVQVINSGTLTFRVPQQMVPSCAYPTANSQIVCMIAGMPVTPGTYQIFAKNNNGTSNGAMFTVTSGSSANNGAPVVSGVDSPSTLSVNQNVRATDVTGGGLSYSVVWGDENQHGQTSAALSPATATFVQSATFNHSYSQVGTYSPRFSVRGSNGLATEVSATVSVQSSGQIQSPVITSISPLSGPYGTVVTVYGSGFSRYDNSISYAGRTSIVNGVESVNGSSLQFTIPATPCSSGMMCAQVVMQPGTYPVSVSNQNGTSNSLNFMLTSGSTGTVNQTVGVGIGQTAIVGSLRLTAVRVAEDSRCPMGVYCIQAGRVVIETNIQSGDSIRAANLAYPETSTNGTSANGTITLDGYTVRITGVTPDARQGGVGSNEYMIMYQVTK